MSCAIGCHHPAVINSASRLNDGLNRVYGPVKRLKQGTARPGEPLPAAAAAQHPLWRLIHAVQAAVRHDLGISSGRPTGSGSAAPLPPQAAPRPTNATSPGVAPQSAGPRQAMAAQPRKWSASRS